MRRNHFRPAACLAIAAAFLSIPALAQQPHHEADRVTSRVDMQQHHALHGHLPPWAEPTSDLGAVTSDISLNHLTVVMARSAATQAAFEQLLDDQQNPNSPRYHQWLTPQQVGEQFGPTDHDVSAVTDWLTSQGLRADAVSPDHMRVTFSGVSGQIGRALGTEFHRYRVHTRKGNEDWLSVSSEPTIPAALTPVISGFGGLSEQHFEPQSIIIANPASQSPEYTVGGSHFLTPADFATIYDIQPAYNAGINGSGVRVAIVGQSRVLASDITTFNTNTGLSPTGTLTTIIPPAGVDPGVAADQGEQTLDVNRVMGTAPGAGIDLVVSGAATVAGTLTPGLVIAISYEVDTLVDPIMNISYGGCEVTNGIQNVLTYQTIFSTAAAEGITTLVSSGDSEAAGCVSSQSAPPSSPPGAGINFFCSSQYVTCVGGTEFGEAASPSTYWRSSNSTSLESAISYIPEGAWNEPQIGSNFQISGTGGGSSVFITKPSWQTGTGVPADGARDTPDIALPAAAGHDGYYFCLNGSCTLTTAGGTSASAPAMAGIMAMVVQKLGKPQGNFNPTLYRLAAATTLAAFHDATPASSGVGTCSTATASICNNSTPGQHALTGGLAGFPLTTGYDLSTGWGSVDVANLLIAVVTPYVTPTVAVTATNSTIALGGSDSFTVTVSGTPGTPSGKVQFFDGSTAIGSLLTLASGTAILSGQVFSTAGTHSITAQYAGDTVFVATTSPVFTLTVNQATPGVTFSTSTTTPIIGQSPTLTATVSGAFGTPTGTVQFLANNVNFGSPVTLVNGVATLSSQSFAAPGSYAVKAQYNGDTNYTAAVSSPTTLTVSQAAPSVALSTSTTTLAIGQSPTLTATVSGALGTPTGTVQFLANNVNFGSPVTLVNGVATLSSQSFAAPGSYVVKVQYSGDSNYTAGTSSTITLTVNQATPGITLSTSTNTLTVGQGAALTATLSGAFGTPTGAVQFLANNVSLGIVPTLNGVATLTTPSFTTSGNYSIVAGYVGDSTYTSITSSPITITVSAVAGTPSYTLTPSSGTLILAPGATTANTYTVTAISTNSFVGTVPLSCNVTQNSSTTVTLGDVPTCSLAPSSVTLTANGTAGTVVTIGTIAPHAISNGGSAKLVLGMGGVLACMLVCVPFTLKKRGRVSLLLAVLAILTLGGGLSGCGSGVATLVSGSPGNSGTPLGNYTVTVAGSVSGALTSTSFTLTVN